MSSRLRHANSTSSKLVLAQVSALLLILALGTAAALRAQSADQIPQGTRPQSRPGTYSVLYSFQCSPDGAYPQSGLIRDSSGNLYGTTIYGGQSNHGTVFKVTPGGTENVLHSFASSDGENPTLGNLTFDAAGNLYRTTSSGGESDAGTVFKVTPAGTESVLHSFCAQPGCTDGDQPYGGVRGSVGDLYGTTWLGGTYNMGVIFKIIAGGTEVLLHSFGSSPSDGAYPGSNLTRDSSGNVYGTTYGGGPLAMGPSSR